MMIAERLRALREAKKLSQGDIERRTGLLRCYISRVENGHTVPAVETLEKLARALEVPIYQLFYNGDEPPAAEESWLVGEGRDGWTMSRKGHRFLSKMRKCLSQMAQKDRDLLLFVGKKMTGHRRG